MVKKPVQNQKIFPGGKGELVQEISEMEVHSNLVYAKGQIR